MEKIMLRTTYRRIFWPKGQSICCYKCYAISYAYGTLDNNYVCHKCAKFPLGFKRKKINKLFMLWRKVFWKQGKRIGCTGCNSLTYLYGYRLNKNKIVDACIKCADVAL